jgi:hypothetical protein
MLKNICICRRAADALPSGRKAGGTANNANNANQAKINNLSSLVVECAPAVADPAGLGFAATEPGLFA